MRVGYVGMVRVRTVSVRRVRMMRVRSVRMGSVRVGRVAVRRVVVWRVAMRLRLWIGGHVAMWRMSVRSWELTSRLC